MKRQLLPTLFVLLLALATAPAFAGVCVGGPDAGDSCVYSSDCRKSCVGGPDNGQSCVYNSDCTKTCSGGPRNGQTCVYGSDCRATCSGGSRNGWSCTFQADCPGGSCTYWTCQAFACTGGCSYSTASFLESSGMACTLPSSVAPAEPSEE